MRRPWDFTHLLYYLTRHLLILSLRADFKLFEGWLPCVSFMFSKEGRENGVTVEKGFRGDGGQGTGARLTISEREGSRLLRRKGRNRYSYGCE